MAERITALRIHPRDNVATCVLAQRAGEAAAYEADGEAVTVRLLDDIPFGHKFAITRPSRAGACTAAINDKNLRKSITFLRFISFFLNFI